MKIELDSRAVRELIGAYFDGGTPADFTLVFDFRHEAMKCVPNEQIGKDEYVSMMLPLDHIIYPEELVGAKQSVVSDWLSGQWVWVETARGIEDNLEQYGHWVRWVDPDHYAIGGTALAGG